MINDSAYTVQRLREGRDGMEYLREYFSKTPINEMNVVFFSTGGVHDNGLTIEKAEQILTGKSDDERTLEISFLLLRPRILSIVYGLCSPVNIDDVFFLKKLRNESITALKKL